LFKYIKGFRGKLRHYPSTYTRDFIKVDDVPSPTDNSSRKGGADAKR
jgi:hypothetical protein